MLNSFQHPNNNNRSRNKFGMTKNQKFLVITFARYFFIYDLSMTNKIIFQNNLKLLAGFLFLIIGSSCAILNQNKKPTVEILSLTQTHILPGLPGSSPQFKYTYTAVINTHKPVTFEKVIINDSLHLNPTIVKKGIRLNDQETTFEKGDTILLNVVVAITDFSIPFKLEYSTVELNIAGNQKIFPYNKVDKAERQILD